MTLREELGNKFAMNQSQLSIGAVFYEYIKDVIGKRDIKIELDRDVSKKRLGCKITENGPIEFKDNRLSLLALCDLFMVNETQAYSIDENSGELEIDGESEDLKQNTVKFSIHEPSLINLDYYIFNILRYAPRVKVIANGIIKSEGVGIYNYKGVNLPIERIGTIHHSGDIVMGGFVFNYPHYSQIDKVLNDQERSLFDTYREAGLLVLDKDAIKVDLVTGRLDATDKDIRMLYDLAKKQWELAVKLKREEFGGKLTKDNLHLILDCNYLANRGKVSKYNLDNETWDGMMRLDILFRTLRIQGGNAARVDRYKGFTKNDIRLKDLIKAKSEGKLLSLPSRLTAGEKEWIINKYPGYYFIKPDIDTLPKIVHDYLISSDGGLMSFIIPKEEADVITKQLSQPDKRIITLKDHSAFDNKTLDYYIKNKDIILITQEEASGTVGKYVVCKLKKKDYNDLKKMGFTTLGDYIEENKVELSLLRIYHIIENIRYHPIVELKFNKEFKERIHKINSHYSQIGVNSYNFDTSSYFRSVPLDNKYRWILDLSDIVQVFGMSTDPRNLELRKELLRDALEKKLKDKYKRETDEICCN